MSIILKGNNISSSNKGIGPSEVTNIKASQNASSIILSWTNPSNVVIDGTTLSTFDHVIIVKNESRYPTSIKDGNTIYSGNGTTCSDSDVIENKKYYYRFFVYDTNKLCNNNMSMICTITFIVVDPIFGNNSLETIHNAIKNDMHKNSWKIGDKIKIYFKQSPTMKVLQDYDGYYDSFNTPAGYVEFAIADFDRKTRWKNDTIKKISSDNNVHYFKYDTEDNQRNIILVQSEACIKGQPLYFDRGGYTLSGYCQSAYSSFGDRFTRSCDEFLRDYSKNDADIYFEDIDYFTGKSQTKDPDNGWNRALTSINGEVTRQKFFRINTDCLFSWSASTGFEKAFSIFTDDASRIFRTSEGTAKEYQLFQITYTSDASGRSIGTDGDLTKYSKCWLTDESVRVICALR